MTVHRLKAKKNFVPDKIQFILLEKLKKENDELDTLIMAPFEPLSEFLTLIVSSRHYNTSIVYRGNRRSSQKLSLSGAPIIQYKSCEIIKILPLIPL